MLLKNYNQSATTVWPNIHKAKIHKHTIKQQFPKAMSISADMKKQFCREATWLTGIKLRLLTSAEKQTLILTHKGPVNANVPHLWYQRFRRLYNLIDADCHENTHLLDGKNQQLCEKKAVWWSSNLFLLKQTHPGWFLFYEMFIKARHTWTEE